MRSRRLVLVLQFLKLLWLTMGWWFRGLNYFVNCRYEVDTSSRVEELQKQLYRYVPVEINGEVC